MGLINIRRSLPGLMQEYWSEEDGRYMNEAIDVFVLKFLREKKKLRMSQSIIIKVSQLNYRSRIQTNASNMQF
jgi:hypothetical protein